MSQTSLEGETAFCSRPGSNRWLLAHKTSALTTELQGRLWVVRYDTNNSSGYVPAYYNNVPGPPHHTSPLNSDTLWAERYHAMSCSTCTDSSAPSSWVRYDRWHKKQQLTLTNIEVTNIMSTIMRFYALMMIMVSMKTFSAFQISFSNVKQTLGKSNTFSKSQITFAQVAVSLALLLGVPAASSGNMLISDCLVCHKSGS